MERNYSAKIANLIKNCLDSEGMHYLFNQEKGSFHFNINLKGAMKYVLYTVIVSEDEYNVYALAPIGPHKDDDEKMGKMAEFVCRANEGLPNGNFELDFNDGDICFKCYVNCDECMPSVAVVKDSLYRPAAMFDCYGAGIDQVLRTGKSPAEAIQFCEEDSVQMSDECAGDELSERMRELLARLHIDELEDEE